MMAARENVVGVILAAGRGTRMRSGMAKLVHELCGQPIVKYVADAARGCGVERNVVVVGFDSDNVRGALGEGFEYVVQEEQAGTGHAVLQVAPLLEGFDGDILVLPGDAPLLTSEILGQLIERHQSSGAAATILTAILPDPGTYGRIVRDASGKVIRIVERRDAGLQEVQVREINSGMYCFRSKILFQLLPVVGRHNAQGEYYLTDVIGLMFARNLSVATLLASDHRVVLGVNNRCELAEAMRIFRERVLEELMLSGVTVIDPTTTYVDATVSIGLDTIIYPFSVIEKESSVGSGCRIGPHSHIVRSSIGDNAVVESSVVIDSSVPAGSHIRPYTVLRAGARESR